MWLPLAVCICWMILMPLDASLVLEPYERTVSQGDNFTFTLRFSQPHNITKEVVLFKEGITASTLCSWDIRRRELITTPVAGYNCGEVPENGTFFLHKSGAHKNDSGHLYCQYGDMKSNNVSLDVTYPPTVKIQPVKPCISFNYSVTESNVSLNCTVISGNPVPTTFRWYHNNKIISKDQTYLISRVEKSNKGLYRCEADNGVTPQGKDKVAINIQYPPTVSVQRRNVIFVNQSRDLDISCTADANPNVTSIVWTKKAGPQMNNKILQLRNVQRHDSGQYVCTAENNIYTCDGKTRINKIKAEIAVKVQYAPVIQSFRILKPDDQKDVTVTENSTVTFECMVDGLPRAKIIIEKEGRLVIQTNNASTLSHVIRSAQCQDRGNVTCSARNILGDVKSDDVKLIVKCSPRVANINTGEMIRTASVNENVTIKLNVIAYPKPVFTLFKDNGTRHVANDTNPVWDGLMATGTITLYNLQSEQFGSYTLRVSNTEGELYYEIDLRSESKPQQPGQLEVYNVKTRSLSLSWGKGFNGGAVQTFVIEYRRNGGQWFKHPTILSEQNDLHLDLEGLEPSTDYEIRLKAKNIYGSSEYIYAYTQTHSELQYGLYGGVGGAVAVVIVVIAVVVIVLQRKRKRGLKSTRQPRPEDGDAVVMEENVMYAGYADVSTSGERGHNFGDVYAVVKKSKKTKVIDDSEVYAYTGANATDMKTDSQTQDSQEADEIYANTGANAVEQKAVPKTGPDEDGLLYVSVDFDKVPTSDIIIGEDVGAGQYTTIDFRSLGGARNKEDI